MRKLKGIFREPKSGKTENAAPRKSFARVVQRPVFLVFVSA